MPKKIRKLLEIKDGDRIVWQIDDYSNVIVIKEQEITKKKYDEITTF